MTSEFTDEIAKTIVDVKYDKKVRKEFMLYEIRMKDLRSEALAEGIAQGMARGKAEGKAEGMAQGLAQGKAEAEIQVAKKSLRLGLSVADVAAITGLPTSQIEGIRSELEAAKA